MIHYSFGKLLWSAATSDLCGRFNLEDLLEDVQREQKLCVFLPSLHFHMFKQGTLVFFEVFIMKFFFDHRWRLEEEWSESQSECQVTECVSVQRSSLKTVRIYFYRLFLFLLISVRAAVTYKYLTANSTESVLYFYCVELKAHYQNKILRSYKSDIFHLIKVDFKKLEFLFFCLFFHPHYSLII